MPDAIGHEIDTVVAGLNDLELRIDTVAASANPPAARAITEAAIVDAHRPQPFHHFDASARDVTWPTGHAQPIAQLGRAHATVVEALEHHGPARSRASSDQ